MATKWHIRKDGTAAPCHAKKKCRLSSVELHGSSKEEALKKYETLMANTLKDNLQGKSKQSGEPSSKKPRQSRLKKHERPVPIKRYEDRKYPTKGLDISVPHDPHSKYAVLSDVDGTLTKGSLVLDHAIYIHDKGYIDLGDLPDRWRADPKNEEIIVELAEKYREDIAGLKVEDLHVEEFLDDYEKIEGKFYSTLDQLKDFKEKGWEVQLISGSPDFLVKPFAERNGFYGKGSEYFTDDEGKLTGDIEGMFGHEAKEGYIKKLVVSRFKRVLAFGDTASDVPLFDSAHHSTLVDPSETTAANVKASLIVRD